MEGCAVDVSVVMVMTALVLVPKTALSAALLIHHINTNTCTYIPNLHITELSAFAGGC